MAASRASVLLVGLLALAPSVAFAQAPDPPATDEPPCDAACVAAATSEPDPATADDPDAGEDAVGADDAETDADVDADTDVDEDDAAADDEDLPPAPGTLDAALADGVVHAGAFAAPRAGRLKAVLVASPGARGPVLGRLATRVARRGRVALDLRLTAAGESLLSDAEDAVTLVARTSWSSRRSAKVRSTERRVLLPLDAG